ncbi:MAG: hypothetical protein RMM53_05830 [Bacteroidia bacterium]|nr:hypothetical protein [Bacteroidia bacterium]MDW8333714.1 hypothetical protein [Bacteroidia bacterium]
MKTNDRHKQNNRVAKMFRRRVFGLKLRAKVRLRAGKKCAYLFPGRLKYCEFVADWLSLQCETNGKNPA